MDRRCISFGRCSSIRAELARSCVAVQVGAGFVALLTVGLRDEEIPLLARLTLTSIRWTFNAVVDSTSGAHSVLGSEARIHTPDAICLSVGTLGAVGELRTFRTVAFDWIPR